MASLRFNRTKKCYIVSKKRNQEVTPPETYPIKGCCEEMLVLASITDSESWKNDVTSAWWKLDDIVNDSVSFELYKSNDTLATIQPSKVQFPNDIAYFATVYWQQVLSTDGVGCYYLKVKYNTNGENKEMIWGEYNLQKYSIERAKGTIRVMVKINQYYSIGDLNFKGTNLIDCLRFGGFFGKMSPNFKVDNLVYQSRKFENVQRERIAKYTMNTDPLSYRYTYMLVNVYLLAENNIWISDYNYFNHSWFYKDIELIVDDSPEIEYQEFAIPASVKCTFTDKVRNNLAKYI